MNFEAAIFDLDGTLLNSMLSARLLDCYLLDWRHAPLPDRRKLFKD